MNGDLLQDYLDALSSDLQERGLRRRRIIEEIRGHLVDSIEAGCRQGLPREAAIREALDRFGSPEVVAARFAAERSGVWRHISVLPAALLVIAIAWFDVRPNQATGVTAFSWFLSGVVFGLFRPKRPWQWALGIGIWICVHEILHHPTLGSLIRGIAMLAVPLAGAYLGAFCRRAFSKIRQADTP